MRQNADKYEWARNMRDEAVREADRYLSLGLERLWRIVPPQSLPRSYGVNQRLGSPVTGKAIDAFGNYPYTADVIREPWKIKDPSSGYVFPTNDFAAYYESGLDERGTFDPKRADRRLLVNTLYPDKGPDWGVDDGFGWRDENGNPYTFVAYYVHWFLWCTGTGFIPNALKALRNAYLFTGDVSYARAGIVLLDRVADVYPDLDVGVYDKTVFLNSHGGRGPGKAIGSIWEPSLVKELLQAYDAFFPAMDDAEAIRFLSEKSERYGLGPKNSASALRSNVENGIVRQIYPSVQSSQIFGNTGFHQSALAMAAVVLDHPPETKEWLLFNERSGGLLRDPYRVTGGNLLAALVNDVDRDGHGNEAAPSYNSGWLSSIKQVADLLREYPDNPASDLYDHPKFRRMFYALLPLICIDRYFPTIGDAGKTGDPGLDYLSPNLMVDAFKIYGDPVFAQAAYLLNGNLVEGIHGGLYDPDPEKIARDIEAVIRQYGPLRLPSGQWTGYGFNALRDDAGRADPGRENGSDRRAQRDVWMYYGRNIGHGHRDALNIGIHAFGRDLAPDLGYPEYADHVDMHRAQWVINTVSHNTVVVNDRKQSPQWVGRPLHFDDAGRVQVMDVEAPNAYPEARMYRRTTAMIRIDAERSYIVDWFRVAGGNEHVYSFHGAEGKTVTENLLLVPQPTGTYAGPDVPFGVRPEGDSVAGHQYEGPGYHWLRRVERDRSPRERFSVEWDSVDTWNVAEDGEPARLKLTMLGRYDEAALADGVPPRNKPGNPASLRYLLVRRSGRDLASVFTSVIEPYGRHPAIRDIRLADVTMMEGGRPLDGNDITIRAVRIELQDGRTDYVICSLDGDRTFLIDGRLAFRGFFGYYSERNGAELSAYLHDGSLIGPVDSVPPLVSIDRITGAVADFTMELSPSNRIVARLNADGTPPDQLAGRYVYVADDGVRNAVYRIEAATRIGDGLYELDIGGTTLIRSFADNSDFAKGYIYDISEGASLYIPLSAAR